LFTSKAFRFGLLSLALSLSACAPTQQGSNGSNLSASAGGNGSTYDGKYFALADLTGQCPDGIRARILVTPDNKAYTTRENCVDLPPPYKLLDPKTFYSLTSDSTVILRDGIYELELSALQTTPVVVCKGIYMDALIVEIQVRKRRTGTQDLWARIGFNIKGFGSMRFADGTVVKSVGPDGSARYEMTPESIPTPEELLVPGASYGSLVVGTVSESILDVYPTKNAQGFAGKVDILLSDSFINGVLKAISPESNQNTPLRMDLIECYSR
jgi:hypothetical protein